MKGVGYEFNGLLWHYKPPKGWFFVSFPTFLSEEIRESFKKEEKGWGRLRATVKIGKTEWKTAIWFDTASKQYLLPLKAEVRKKENLVVGEMIKVQLWI